MLIQLYAHFGGCTAVCGAAELYCSVSLVYIDLNGLWKVFLFFSCSCIVTCTLPVTGVELIGQLRLMESQTSPGLIWVSCRVEKDVSKQNRVFVSGAI